jgi:uncharacterized membrane protein
MRSVTEVFHVSRPVDGVFNYISNMEHTPEWANGVTSSVKQQEGPIGAGTDFLVTSKIGPKKAAVVYHLTNFELGRAFSANGDFGFVRFEETFHFSPEEDGTRIHAVLLIRPKGIMSLLAPLLAPLMERQFRSDYRRLKQRLEQG